MIRWVSLLLGGWLLIISAPLLAISPMQNDLQLHQTRWRDRKIDSYEFTLQIQCFCPPPANIPLKIWVKQGKIVKVTNSQTQQQLTLPLQPDVKTIDQLFEIINQAIQQKVDHLVVTYDAQWGYPTKIVIDPQKMIADEETSYFVTDFKKN